MRTLAAEPVAVAAVEAAITGIPLLELAAAALLLDIEGVTSLSEKKS